jgi:hypothetical protein
VFILILVIKVQIDSFIKNRPNRIKDKECIGILKSSIPKIKNIDIELYEDNLVDIQEKHKNLIDELNKKYNFK